MLGFEFNNKTTEKYVGMFGTLFNDIVISRYGNDGSILEKRFKVPLGYGPYQKFLSRVKGDPELDRPQAISLPRMSFELTDYQYDGERKISNAVDIRKPIAGDNQRLAMRHIPVPYNLTFQLNIMSKYEEDMNQIIEQILPFFRPDWTSSVFLLPDNPDYSLDIPIVLNSLSKDDQYEGSYEERRTLIWTLTFTMKGYFFGPTSTKKIIKFVTASTYGSINAIDPLEIVTVQPGLTANGQPTTDVTQSIPWQQINKEDDWAYIVKIEDDT